MRYFAIFRLVGLRALFWFAVAVFLGTLGSQVPLALFRGMFGLPAIPVLRAGPAMLLGAAYFSGLTLAVGLRRIQDRPQVWVLPGSRRMFGIWHGAALAAAAGVACWLWGLSAQRASLLPFPGSLGWFLIGLSLNSPVDRRPGRKEFWSWLALGATCLAVAGGTWAPELAALARPHPLALLLLGFAAAGWNGWAWQRRERTRGLASLRFGAAPAIPGVELANAMPTRGAPSYRPRLTLGRYLVLVLGTAPFLLIVSLVFEGTYRTASDRHGLGMAVVATCILCAADSAAIVPRSCREPISRRERLGNARRNFWRICLVGAVAVVVFQLANEAGGALRHGPPYRMDFRIPLFAGGVALLLQPLTVCLWLMGKGRLGVSRSLSTFAMILLWSTVISLAEWFWLPRAVGHPWVWGWLAGFGIIGILCGACELSLRGFFLRGDLPTGSGPA